MLTQAQNDELRRDIRQKLFCLIPANATIIATYGPFNDEVTDLLANIVSIQDLAPDKIVDSKPVTGDKTFLKHEVSDYYENLCGRVCGFAIKFDHSELRGLMEVVKAYKIFEMKDNDVKPYIIKLNGYINPWLLEADFLAYEIVTLDLTTGLGKATDFASKISVASGEIGGGHVANVDINKVFVKVEANQNQFVLLISHFAITQPTFVTGFQEASVYIHTGHLTNGLIGEVTGGPDNHALVATITNVTLDRSVDCDLLGAYEMSKMIPRLYQFRISCPGYVDQIVVIRIKKREKIIRNFHLELIPVVTP